MIADGKLTSPPSPSRPTLNDIPDFGTRRDVAREQAEHVLEAVGGSNYLDGFNLLGVVANPRGASSYSPLSPSFHGRYSVIANAANAAAVHAASPTPHGPTDYLADTYNSFESTLAQFNEQVEYFNQILEDLSRQILEPSDGPSPEELPESQLKELPTEFQTLDLKSLQRYLEKSGMLAHSFSDRLKQQEVLGSVIDYDPIIPPIPDVFFQPFVDLTDPIVFNELLLHNISHNPNGTLTEHTDDTDKPISEWFPLLPPDAFGTSLDKVELALLHQVRSKSGAFFAESLRFRQLQQWIQELLEKVSHLQEVCVQLQRDLVDPREAVPLVDRRRNDLRRLQHVLEQTYELLECKSSLTGTLSAQDDLTAVQQIGYARRLLAGSDDHHVDLSKVLALSAAAKQLDQYEHLVTGNLRDEVVEIFLDWNATVCMPGYGHADRQVRERVRELLAALRYCDGGLVACSHAYNSRLQDMIRMTVRTTVGEFAREGLATDLEAVGSMSLSRFLDCLDLLFEHLLGLLTSAVNVNEFCTKENLALDNENDAIDNESGPLGSIVSAAAELASKTVSELLRMRKETHSLVSLEEMKSLWDSCISFVSSVEKMSGKPSALRSTLLTQAKSFMERRHESNMSALAASLDSERWTQCDVSTERQDSLTRLCSGRTTMPTRINGNAVTTDEKKNEAEVEGKRFKVVWSCLLLMEMAAMNVSAAALFPSLASGAVAKVAELLRLFNSRTTHLVLGAGAIHSNAKLKSINAKHLSIVTQCLSMAMAVLPHIRAALMAHMPKKQHPLLNDLDQIRREYADHKEKVLNKFVTIIGGIVEHALAPQLAGTNFDERVSEPQGAVCVFLDGVATNTKKMHQVLSVMLPPDHLKDVFSRIFAFVDTKVPALLIASSGREDSKFTFPETDGGKQRLLNEMQSMIAALNSLEGVLPWDFTATNVLARNLDYQGPPIKGDVNHDTTLLIPYSAGHSMQATVESAADHSLNEHNAAEKVQDSDMKSDFEDVSTTAS